MKKTISIFLAEDDADDCILFKEALGEQPLTNQLTVLGDGEILMRTLTQNDCILPDVLFLDINMPRKNGLECLKEIKRNKALEQIPVIILSTSFELEIVKQVYEHGAIYYLRKPTKFSDLRLIILKSLQLLFEEENTPSDIEEFVLNPDGSGRKA